MFLLASLFFLCVSYIKLPLNVPLFFLIKIFTLHLRNASLLYSIKWLLLTQGLQTISWYIILSSTQNVISNIHLCKTYKGQNLMPLYHSKSENMILTKSKIINLFLRLFCLPKVIKVLEVYMNNLSPCLSHRVRSISFLWRKNSSYYTIRLLIAWSGKKQFYCVVWTSNLMRVDDDFDSGHLHKFKVIWKMFIVCVCFKLF